MSDHTSQPGPGDDGIHRAGELGQAISRHLFTVGLDLNFVLMTVDSAGLAAARLRHAIDEIDNATVSLRHLMVEQGLRDTLAMCQQAPPTDPVPSHMRSLP